MTFNIGSQSGGVINNVAGDQHIAGGQHGSAVSTYDARQAVDALRAALDGSALDPRTAEDVRAEVDELESAVKSDRPDPQRAAGSLKRLTEILSSAGAFASAGAALVGPLRTLATWAGPLAGRVIEMLPVL